MLLSQEQAKSMLINLGDCQVCKQAIVRAYCRDCDEFLEEGHALDCPLRDTTHMGHRLQRKDDDIRTLRGY
jgi:hypothetical protein